VLYAVGPDGETGPMAGRGGIIFWWMSLPGQLIGWPLHIVRVPVELGSIVGNIVLWGATAMLVSSKGLWRGKRAREGST
jgi:hypothetical protein